jgi:integration host factor subunit alpha
VSAEITEALFSILKKTLESGENLKISGFGHFTVKQKADRVGRNPKTGEQLIIKSRQVVTFKPSNILRQAVNGEAQ